LHQEKFQNTVNVFEATAGADALANHHGMHEYIMSTNAKYANKTYDKLSDAEQAELGTKVQDRLLAMLMMANDCAWFGKLVEDMHHAFLQGHDS
jgi:hypothetical protein